MCQLGVERRTQRDSAITSALALRQLFYVEGEVLEKVESFRYLRRIPIQDNEDVRAVQNKIKKAWGIRVQVGQVLQTDNTPPNVSTKFYLQGGRAVGPPLRQQDMEPHNDRTGAVGGVLHQSHIPYG